MSIGILKFFNAEKGYGFIKLEDGGGDVFVHVSAAERSGIRAPLQEGMRLSFDIESDRRTGKLRAGNLRLCSCG